MNYQLHLTALLIVVTLALTCCTTATSGPHKDISKSPEAATVCNLLANQSAVRKTVNASSGTSRVRSEITSTSVQYTGVGIDGAGNLSLTETISRLYVDPVSGERTQNGQCYQYSIPLAEMEKTESVTASSSASTSPGFLFETQQDTWVVACDAKGFRSVIKKNDSLGHKDKEGCVILTFQTKAKAEAFARAWNALVTSLHARG